MNTKAVVTPVKKSTPTPIPQLSPTVGLTSVRPFADEQLALKEDDSSSEQKLVGAAPPPPEIQRNQNTNSGYNFSQISISEYIPATPQAKLVVGAPGDKYEKEADAMADKVVSTVVPVQPSAEQGSRGAGGEDEQGEVNLKPTTDAIQAPPEEEGTIHLKPTTDSIQAPPEDEGTIHLKPLTESIQSATEEEGTVHLKPLAQTIQRYEQEATLHLKRLSGILQQKEIEGVVHLKAIDNHIPSGISQTLKQSTLISRQGNGGFTASENIETRVKSSKGGGNPLPDETRDFMEDRFGNDFSGVKVHTGSDAVQLSKDLGAQAFTHEQDVYFNSGKYSPHTDEGKKLLAHELTHTIQQTGPKIKPKSLSRKIQKKSQIQRQIQPSAVKNRVKKNPPLNLSGLKTLPEKSLQKEDKNKSQPATSKTEDKKATTTDTKTEAKTETKTEEASVTKGDTKETAETKAEERKKNVEKEKEEAKKELAEEGKDKEDKAAEMKKYLAAESLKKVETQTAKVKEDTDTVKNKVKSGESGENLGKLEKESGEKIESQAKQEGQEAEAKVKDKADEKGKQDASGQTPSKESVPLPLKVEPGAVENPQGPLEQTDQPEAVPPIPEGEAKTADTSPIAVPEVRGDQAPATPEADPAFGAVIKQSKQQADQQASHQSPRSAAEEAQTAAKDPDQQMREAQATKMDDLNAKKPKPFDRKVFEDSLLEKLQLVKPKNADQADNFASSGKTDDIKNALNTEVKGAKKESGGGLPEEAKAPPEPAAEQPKNVDELKPTQEVVGTVPPEIEAEKAVPKPKTDKEIEEPLAKTTENLEGAFGEIQAKSMVGSSSDPDEVQADQIAEQVITPPLTSPNPSLVSEGMTDAIPPTPLTKQRGGETIQLLPEVSIQRKEEVKPQSVAQPDTEVPLDVDRLETWKEEGGGQALDALKEAKTHGTTEGPQKFRQGEQETLTTAKTDAQASAKQSNQDMYATRTESMQQTGDSQEATKTQDEIKRTEINANIQSIFDKTQGNVKAILGKMDSDVNTEFNRGISAAKNAFEGHVKRRMAEYKDKRYTLVFPIKLPKPYWFGIKMVKVGELRIFDFITWIRDKFAGLPDEVNVFYEEGKKLYIEEVKKSISNIGGIVEKGLTAAQTEVNQGREKVNAYVQTLPKDLQEIGAQSAADVQTKFDQLEQSISDKQNQLLEDLTKKYQSSLKELDKRIEQLKAENASLISKALKFIGDLAKNIIKLLLWPIKKILSVFIGALAEDVIDALIDDPVLFMKNLFKGIGDGIKNFANNIGKHLLNGLITWLFGNLGDLKLPEKFDLKGFLDIILQVLGLTKDYIFGIVENILGGPATKLIQFILDVVLKKGIDSLNYLWDLVKLVVEAGPDVIMTLINEGVEAVETFPDSVQNILGSISGGLGGILGFAKDLIGSLGEDALDFISGLQPGVKFIFTFFSTLIKDGISGVWEFIKSSLDDMKKIFLKGLMEMAIVEIVKAGISWLIGMMNPASGIAKIAKVIFDVISFFVEKREDIKLFVQAILDTLKAICDGTPAVMAMMIEQALAKMIPVLLGFLASLIGVGGIPSKIKKIVTTLKAPVDKTIGGIFAGAAGFFGGSKSKKGKTARKAKGVGKGKGKGKGKTAKDKKNKDKKQPQNDAKKQIKGAGHHTQNIARNLRDPDAVGQKLSGIQSKHKLKQLKLTKKGKNKYQIVGQVEATKVQRQVDSGVSQEELPLNLMVQRSAESVWKDKKNQLVVKQKITGNKKKASLTLTAKLMAKNKILPKVAQKLKSIINKKPKPKAVKSQLPALKSQYKLKTLSLNTLKPDGSKYVIIGVLPDDEQSTKAQRQAAGTDQMPDAHSGVETAIQRSLGQGQPLPAPVREPMENAFGFDFAQVRIHHDTEGDRLSRSLDARAFTTGSDVFFRQGAYAPHSPGGTRLLAHELTHVVQQSGESPTAPSPLLYRTVQRVSQEVPYFVQREAENNSEGSEALDTNENPSKSDKSSQTKALVGAGLLIAGSMLVSGLSMGFGGGGKQKEQANITKSIRGNKLTMRVMITKQQDQDEQQNQRKKKGSSVANNLALPDDIVDDIVTLIQQIVNQYPDPDIVQKKLDKLCVDFDLDLLKVVGSATIGSSISYDIQVKGRPQEPTDENTAAIAKNLDNLTPKEEGTRSRSPSLFGKGSQSQKEAGTRSRSPSLLGKGSQSEKEAGTRSRSTSLLGKGSQSEKEDRAKEDQPKKTSEKATKEPQKPIKDETKENQAFEKLADEKQGSQPQSTKASKGQKTPLDVNTKVKRIDPATVEISVRADPKKK
ncbi:conserved hypothetical protein [Planktothrix sp. PCC 11201]|uniref:eCIS core domain-containing protein n=1 Tax=Planktothrix sp. PCC 11201 TaxID=1729650 RepID=UPI00091CB449|nr:DUF4157 domain-containing protein [Planktothrix sp. PCC 11201]SKB15626.1 conserved hypothetical protein [Planktothrix sp. PCC 11201]